MHRFHLDVVLLYTAPILTVGKISPTCTLNGLFISLKLSPLNHIVDMTSSLLKRRTSEYLSQNGPYAAYHHRSMLTLQDPGTQVPVQACSASIKGQATRSILSQSLWWCWATKHLTKPTCKILCARHAPHHKIKSEEFMDQLPNVDVVFPSSEEAANVWHKTPYTHVQTDVRLLIYCKHALTSGMQRMPTKDEQMALRVMLVWKCDTKWNFQTGHALRVDGGPPSKGGETATVEMTYRSSRMFYTYCSRCTLRMHFQSLRFNVCIFIHLSFIWFWSKVQTATHKDVAFQVERMQVFA